MNILNMYSQLNTGMSLDFAPNTGSDAWSVGTFIVVCFIAIWLVCRKKNSELD
jgi:lipoprotein signal peptidase